MENWVIKNKKADFELIIKECGISEVLARCLVNKGLTTIEPINNYLHPQLNKQHDPLLLKDMKIACDILANKILQGKKIRIIGDYDVDGVVATYILYRTLIRVGADVSYDIPDRIQDGYGINVRMVEAAYNDRIDTLLTCDNGITAIEQIEKAKQYNMTVIVTDHHSLIQAEDDELVLPGADAVINPKRPDCNYPFKGLCGAAVAYKLSIALLRYYEINDNDDFILELMSYAAIATVCDVMELVDENRVIVKHGLELLKSTHNKGLLALMDAAGVVKEQLNTFHLGYVIGPCLNASGRLNTAKMGLELLLADSSKEAVRLAGEVRDLNNLRKNMTFENVEKAVSLIEESNLKNDKVLVIYLEDCHESIAGIIAGRIRERYNRPTIVLTDAENCVKGSGRSIEQYNMIDELQQYRFLFLKLGGHPMAAGLSMLRENIEEMRMVLNSNTSLTDEMLIPKVTIDIHLPLGYVTEALMQELKLMEPFGKGNEKPLFAEKNLKIRSAFIIGKNSSGLRLRVINQYGREMDAVYFGDVDMFFNYISDTYGSEEAGKLQTGRSSNAAISITYYPSINEYNGFKNLQLNILNYR
jgi:single-stranded-DNA-specific exonuclease